MEQPKIGVYICDCGINIAATVNVSEVVTFAKRLPNVTVAREYKYMCYEPGQNMIRDDIRELGLDRVVVASCTPRMHETTFQTAVAEAGLNPYYFAMANIREHCSWVIRDMAQATAKAKRLVSSAVYRVAYQEDPGGHGRRWRHRRHPGRAHDRRCWLPGLSDRAGALHWRPHGGTGQDLPHARL